MDEIEAKVVAIASEICWRYGRYKGDLICQDWGGATDKLDALTPEEKNTIMKTYQDYNSDGEDFVQDDFPYDGMVVSFAVARYLETMLGEK